MIRQRLAGLAATSAIAALLIGLPALLLHAGLGTLATLNGWASLARLLLQPDDGTLPLVALKAIGWVTWALLTLLTALEILTRVRGARPLPLPGLHAPQVAVAHLVTVSAMLFVAIPHTAAIAQASPPATSRDTTSGQTLASALGPATPTTRAAATVETIDTNSRTATRPRTVEYTVKRGDSLWSIAATHLGDGRRYTEIAALNSRLLNGKGDDFLRAGWILTIPADHTPTTAPNDGSHPIRYTVRPGDTLSEVAFDYLGAPIDYPEIFAASRDITQPDGRHLTDPNLIEIGWTLDIPQPGPTTPVRPNADARTRAGATASAHPAPTSDPDAPTPSPGPSASAAHAPAQAEQTPIGAEQPPAPAEQATPGEATTTRAAPHAVAAEAATGEAVPMTIPTWMVPGLIGTGALLAGSLWLALGRRRAAQARARRPGRLIAPPSSDLLPLEKTLRTEGDAATLDVEFVDQSLRRLASRTGRAGGTMPAVATIELSPDHLILHLAEVADLPAPWQSAPDRLNWQISTTVDLDQIGPLNPALPAPYPQLVTLGNDDHDHRWLYNLEEAGVIRITGDPDCARDLVRHIVAELAVHPWTVYVRIECVGIARDATVLNPRRVRHHDAPDVASSLIADTVAQIGRAHEAGLDITTGRAILVDDPLWDSRLLVLDATPTDDTKRLASLLLDHAQATGTAVVLIDTPGDSQASHAAELQLTANGTLHSHGVGLTLRAAGLTAAELAGCAAIFAQADQSDVAYPNHHEAADGWRSHATQAGQLRPDHTLPRDEPSVEPTTSVLPEDDQSYLDAAATTSDDLARLSPNVPTTSRERLEQDDPTLDADVATWFSTHCDLPRLMLLGPLVVRVALNGNPAAAAGRRPYFTELLSYLATRPYGATTEEVADAMRIPIDRVRKDMLALRTWLGTNPRTGRPHIPDSRHTQAARSRGRAAYQLEDVLIDADLFRRLRARAESRGTAGLDDLRQALRLVRGTPFAELRRGGGAWLSDDERLDQILQCAIVDTAHTVTIALLDQGDFTGARATAELAARVAPDEDTPRLDLAATLTAGGHRHAANEMLRRLICNRSDDEAGTPAELPARTDRVMARKRWLERPDSQATA